MWIIQPLKIVPNNVLLNVYVLNEDIWMVQVNVDIAPFKSTYYQHFTRYNNRNLHYSTTKRKKMFIVWLAATHFGDLVTWKFNVEWIYKPSPAAVDNINQFYFSRKNIAPSSPIAASYKVRSFCFFPFILSIFWTLFGQNKHFADC